MCTIFFKDILFQKVTSNIVLLFTNKIQKLMFVSFSIYIFSVFWPTRLPVEDNCFQSHNVVLDTK